MIFIYGCLVSVPTPHPSTHLIALDKISTEVDTIMLCMWALLVEYWYFLCFTLLIVYILYCIAISLAVIFIIFIITF